MIFRRFLIIVWFFCLLFPLYTQDSLSKLYIQEVVYKGPDKEINTTISDIVKEEFVLQGMFEIVDTKNEAGYILFCTIEEENDELVVFMEISGTAESKIKEIVVKKEKKDNGLDISLHEAIKYLHRKIFPFKIYVKENESFFTAKAMEKEYNKDIIDREGKRTGGFVRIHSSEWLIPLNQKLFEKYRFQLLPSCEVAFPLNLLDKDVDPTLYIHIPVHYYIFTTKIIMISLLAEGTYFFLRKQISLDSYNTLNVIGIDAGVGVCYPLPFYNKTALHLNICGGGVLSLLSSDQVPGKISLNIDPCFHPSFEIEHSITENFSFSIKCSYIWIFYVDENLHLLQTGVGFGYRF